VKRFNRVYARLAGGWTLQAFTRRSASPNIVLVEYPEQAH
jgi:hypothetical protein